MSGIKIIKKQVVIPTYDINGKDITPGRRERNIRRAVAAIILSAILIFIYLPGLFMEDPYNGEITRQAVAPDGTAIKKLNNVVRNNTEEDFDGDGITNADEEKYGTDLWDVDTDGDGAYDLYEINTSKTDPTKYNKEVLNDIQTKLDEEKGVKVGSPYKVGNVILRAADYTSKAHGSVVETPRGYRFTNFSGYAQFPATEGRYAYRVVNGERQLMTSRMLNEKTDEKVWEIHQNDTVELYYDRLEETVEIKLFGKPFYLGSTKATRALAKVLPDRGFICGKLRMRKDVEPNVADPVTTDIKKPVYDSEDGYRYTVNTNTLNQLQTVRKSIEEHDTCIAVSLYNRNYGEYIAIVYGYTSNGNLLLADIDTLKPIGVLGITERASMVVNNDGEMLSRSYFDFDGFGFHSYNGDRICFFAASSGTISGDYDTKETTGKQEAAGKQESADTQKQQDAKTTDTKDTEKENPAAAGTTAEAAEEAEPAVEQKQETKKNN